MTLPRLTHWIPRGACTRATGFVLLLSVVALPGCGSAPATMTSWKKAMGDYVQYQGNGDANVLRNLPVHPSGYRVFSVQSNEDPLKGSDVTGALLGYQMVAGEEVYIFLIALVERGKAVDVRVATFTPKPGGHLWRIGRADADATNRYAAKMPTAGMMFWPNAGDLFDVNVNGQVITVREQATNVAWSLDLKAANAEGARLAQE